MQTYIASSSLTLYRAAGTVREMTYATAYIAGVHPLRDLWRTTPHNEYLYFLVEGGVVGFGLFLAAIGLWYHQLLQVVRAHNRAFLLALAPALTACAFTVDLLIYWAGLPLFAYLGVLAARGRASASLPKMCR
jgi:O-antigen ligase